MAAKRSRGAAHPECFDGDRAALVTFRADLNTLSNRCVRDNFAGQRGKGPDAILSLPGQREVR